MRPLIPIRSDGRIQQLFLAITQVVVEVIAVVLLIRVVVTRSDTSHTTPRDALQTGLAPLVGGVLLVVVFFAVGGIAAVAVAENFGVAGAQRFRGFHRR